MRRTLKRMKRATPKSKLRPMLTAMRGKPTPTTKASSSQAKLLQQIKRSGSQSQKSLLAKMRTTKPKPRPKPRPKPWPRAKKPLDPSKGVGGPGWKPLKPPAGPAPSSGKPKPRKPSLGRPPVSWMPSKPAARAKPKPRRRVKRVKPPVRRRRRRV